MYRLSRLKHLHIALLLALLATTIMVVTYKDYGITWDEPVYVRKATLYLNWMTHPSIETIDYNWNIWDMHPPLVKELGAVSIGILTNTLHAVNFEIAYRMGNSIVVFALVFGTYLFMAKRYGAFVGMWTALSVFFLPRLFYEAHIGGLDYVVTVLSFLTIITFIEGFNHRRWFIVSALLLGLAHLTKLQGFFLYVPIGLTWLWFLKTYPKKWKKTFIENIFPMTLIPPFVFWLGWPRMWFHPIARFIEYFTLELGKYRVEVYYLGQTYHSVAPWHYPFIMTLVTVPIITLFFFFLGTFFIFRKAKSFEWLLLFETILPLIIIAAPGVSKYDGVRMILPAFPFLCAVGGIGVSHILSIAKKKHLLKPVTFTILVALMVTVFTGTILTHPYQSSYYNELVGGIDGAQKLGFETEYWGNAYIGVLPWMNAHKANTFCIYPLTEAFDMYKQMGLLDENISYTTFGNPCDYFILLSRQGFFFSNPHFWDIYTNNIPVYSVTLSHTHLVNVYKL